MPDRTMPDSLKNWTVETNRPGLCAVLFIPPHPAIPNESRRILINPSPCTEGEDDAIANLIGCAPALYEWLFQIVAEYEERGSATNDTMRNARIILKKARGQA